MKMIRTSRLTIRRLSRIAPSSACRISSASCSGRRGRREGPLRTKSMRKPSWLSNRDPSVARGPTWWNLRDYYNLYKRMAGKVLKARAYYPNRSSIGYAHSDLLDTIQHLGGSPGYRLPQATSGNVSRQVEVHFPSRPAELRACIPGVLPLC